jgi:DNA-binding NtrC family response regulator
MSDSARILIVDDDQSILAVLEARLQAAGFRVLCAASGPAALELLKSKPVDVLVSDMKMPEMSGMELYAEATVIQPQLPVIFLTAYGTIPDAVSAVKAGAVDYLTKPFDGKELVKKISQFLATLERTPAPVHATADDNGFIWGSSAAMQDLKAMLHKVAGSNANVLVLGESGVGKEYIAKLLHHTSSRRNHPYIVVDCGSTPAGILESELFGHIKGSFTHAIQDKKGLIEAANGGTLFLDEIGNISTEMQSRLLRFLEERKIRQVGAIKEKSVDCRVIAATNADLKKAVEEGDFRQDLYYRLKVVTLQIPPLRERRADIPELARHLVDEYCRRNRIPPCVLPNQTLQWLETLPWPGNVRELKNALQTGIILCEDNRIMPEDLQLDEEPEMDFRQMDGDDFSMEQSEKEAIIRALRQTKGVKKEAAELLGISRRAIQYKSKKYNLDSSQFKD